MIVWLIFMLSIIYMELVYHIGCFGLMGGNLLLPLGLIGILVSIQTLVVGWTKGRLQKVLFWFFMISEYLVFAVQTVYYTIFRQPLQIRAAIFGGGDALTNYWREALAGILKALPILVLLVFPFIIVLTLQIRKKWKLNTFESLQKIRGGFALGVSAMIFFVVINVGHRLEAEYYEEYTEFYAPLSVVEKMGVVTMVQRDCFLEIETFFAEKELAVMEPVEDENFVLVMTPFPEDMETATPELTVASIEPQEEAETPVPVPVATQEPTPAPEPTPTPEPVMQPYAFELDLGLLTEAVWGEDQKEWLAEYITNLTPTKENEYTGMFEGYNLIFLTAEGFSTYAIHPELTPTLYKLANTGFVFNNYYVPLWQTSTSDGEYINCTGLIPDGQFSMRKSGSNNMAYTLPKFFATTGAQSFAYHNNSLSYYDRYKTHPNLGYLFKAAKLGECAEEEWGSYIFSMENPDKWPASDLEMLQGTVSEYIGLEQFNVYYMTISGHMYYSFTGNSMSAKNKEAVQHLEMSENARAYIACHIELDKALEYLLQELEAAGKLENTVICLSADHYPYAMTEEEYEELAGKDLSENLDKFRNTLILWNAGIEEPVVVDKACGSMDLVPTLLNLFGYDFDSRMYAGRDIFSEEEGLVIFNDRSFVSDTVYYDTLNDTIVWKKELTAEEQETYLDKMKAEVKNRYQFSAYVLREDFYEIIEECRLQ